MSMHMSNSAQRAEINMTPMIDVLLVLIIIFLIIPRDKTHGEEAEVPHPATETLSNSAPDRTVVIEMHSTDGEHATLSINRQPVAWEQLQTALTDIYKQRAEKVLFLQGDKDVPFEDAARVISAAHDVDPSIHVGLMTASASSD